MPAMSRQAAQTHGEQLHAAPRPGTAVTAGRGCHGQMPTGHKSSSRAARADGRDAQKRKIWRKAHSISVGSIAADSRRSAPFELLGYRPVCAFPADLARSEGLDRRGQPVRWAVRGALGGVGTLGISQRSLAGLSAGFPLALYMFIGWENGLALAEESRDPRRTIPRALYISVAIAAVLYVLFAYATVTVSATTSPLSAARRSRS